jgi:hypothetical protein
MTEGYEPDKEQSFNELASLGGTMPDIDFVEPRRRRQNCEPDDLQKEPEQGCEYADALS